jgi:CHAP domain-containing protein
MGTSSLRVFRYGQAPISATLATVAALAAFLLVATPALADTGGTAPPDATTPKKQQRPKPRPTTSTVKSQPAKPRKSIDQPPPSPSVPVSGDVRTRIVAMAQSQLGQSESPPGSNCTKFGPCEAWCADFATWVWRQAGVSTIGRIAWVPALVDWGKQHGTWKAGADNNPRPGDLVIFSGLHVGIVETVRSSGIITIIAGNTGTENVARRGPASWDNGTAMGPAAISGYVSPPSGTQARASTASALPQPTPAQMAAQDPQDHGPHLAAQER